jgi:hypothetical protein
MQHHTHEQVSLDRDASVINAMRSLSETSKRAHDVTIASY